MESYKGDLIEAAMTSDKDVEFAVVGVVSVRDGERYFKLGTVGAPWDMEGMDFAKVMAQLKAYTYLLENAKLLYGLHMGLNKIKGGKEDWADIVERLLDDAQQTTDE